MGGFVPHYDSFCMGGATSGSNAVQPIAEQLLSWVFAIDPHAPHKQQPFMMEQYLNLDENGRNRRQQGNAGEALPWVRSKYRPAVRELVNIAGSHLLRLGGAVDAVNRPYFSFQMVVDGMSSERYKRYESIFEEMGLKKRDSDGPPPAKRARWA